MKLRYRLPLLFILMALVPVLVVGCIAFESARQAVEKQVTNHLISVNLLKSSELKRWIDDNMHSLEELAQRPLVRQYAGMLEDCDQLDPDFLTARDKLVMEHLMPGLRMGGGFTELFLLCPRQGIILASTDKLNEGKYRSDRPYFVHGKEGTYFQGVYYSVPLQSPAMTVSTPVRDARGNLVAVMAGRLDLSELSKIIKAQSGMSTIEDTYLVNTAYFFITEPRFGQDYALKKTVHTRGVERGLAGEDGVDFYSDYRGVPVIGAFKWLPEYNMCMITEVEQAEAYSAIYRAGWPILGTVLVIVAAVIVVGLLVARDITLPLRRLVAGTDEIGRGNLDCRMGIQSPDELGELSRAFDRMVEKLKSTTISRDELEVKVRQRTERLDEVNRELEAFAYSVSHDLRAPLRAINGFISILLEEYEQKLDAEGRRICEVIADSARNMGTLIDDLLAFSRSGRAEINSTQIDMEKLARSVFDELTDPRQRQHIQLHVGALPPAVADRTLIHQVWVNLISNAIKFSAGKETPVISIDGESLNGENIYRVQDNGVGFDMKYADRLFGVFQRLHSSTQFEGNGVGLAIVKRVVNRHGGRVWAEGMVDRGAVFYFTLPGR